MKTGKSKRISLISAMHIWKLVFRSLLFAAALAVYVVNRINGTGTLFGGFESRSLFLLGIWAVFAVEMILRFFPSSTESMGCQKQFKRNYVPRDPSEETKPVNISGLRTFSVAAAWIGLNSIIALLYYTDVIDAGIMVLISLAYAVCDMVCILFFCPFQTWFMKNKCCGTCRIYNWDYAMMFTPLVFVPNLYAVSLFVLALVLLLRWEITYKLYPRWFSEATNANLTCANCREKLCAHKKQLRKFLKTVNIKIEHIPAVAARKAAKAEKESNDAHSGNI